MTAQPSGSSRVFYFSERGDDALRAVHPAGHLWSPRANASYSQGRMGVLPCRRKVHLKLGIIDANVLTFMRGY